MKINTLNDYLKHTETQFTETWETIGESLGISKEVARSKFKDAKTSEYRGKIEPYIDAIGEYRERGNNLFSTVDGEILYIAIYNGSPCVFFKKRNQRLERYCKLI